MLILTGEFLKQGRLHDCGEHTSWEAAGVTCHTPLGKPGVHGSLRLPRWSRCPRVLSSLSTKDAASPPALEGVRWRPPSGPGHRPSCAYPVCSLPPGGFGVSTGRKGEAVAHVRQSSVLPGKGHSVTRSLTQGTTRLWPSQK